MTIIKKFIVTFILLISLCVAGSSNKQKRIYPQIHILRHGNASWNDYGDRRGNILASRTYSCGSVIKVYYRDKNNKVHCVTGIVGDWGPNSRLNRALDLNKCMFKQLSPTSRGVIPVTYVVVKIVHSKHEQHRH